ncbi:MAG: restriction endonuclease [Bacteroidales bacterium]|nr:restriction endonuclease [Bacteroidales bacterium]
MKSANFNITKKSGDIIRFDSDKLRKSFERSGASEKDIDDVIKHLSENVYDGITTKRLFQLAYTFLRKRSLEVAGRYRLKNAIMELGPTGYPFERFIAELMKYQGFDTEVGVIVEGHCISHEVDVVAQKEEQKIMIECKFHGNTHTKSDVKVALYIHSRYNDVLKTWKKTDPKNIQNYQGWIVTNTRFTQDAVDYANCAGLHLVSWDYPSQGSLRERIDISGLHPITVLHSISKREKQLLLDKGLVLCRMLTAENLKKFNISGNRIRKVLQEAYTLTAPK